MRIFIIFSLCTFVLCVKHTKSLTESMGQEVIEIGTPIKELPDLEEEPSAENEEEKSTSTTIQAATQKQIKKTAIDPANKLKDIDKIDGRRQDEDEARIEKELADIYKDTADYKADSAEASSEASVNATEETEKPIARARYNFKFEPDSFEPRAVASFRTSIDEISCKKTQQLSVYLAVWVSNVSLWLPKT